MKETDIFYPVKDYFENNGYNVQAEVKNCDITAIKDDKLIIAELKLRFNITLLFQAMTRQKITPWVYVVIPRPKRANDKNYKNTLNLLSRLGLGLIIVAADSPVKTVDVVLEPTYEGYINKKKFNSVVKEAKQRNFPNIGGSTGKKINTAFRERCIKIACITERLGQVTPSILIKEYDCPKDTANIFYRNYYGWFERVSRGSYRLSPEGRTALEDDDFKQAVNYYREIYSENFQKV